MIQLAIFLCVVVLTKSFQELVDDHKLMHHSTHHSHHGVSNECTLYSTLNVDGDGDSCITNPPLKFNISTYECLYGWIGGCRYMLTCVCGGGDQYSARGIVSSEYYETGGCHGHLSARSFIPVPYSGNACKQATYACVTNPPMGKRGLTNEEFLKCCPQCMTGAEP
eukprot:206994_1